MESNKFDPTSASKLHKAASVTEDAAEVVNEIAAKLKGGTQYGSKKLSKDLKIVANALELVSETAKCGAGRLGGASSSYAFKRLRTVEIRQSKAATGVQSPLSNITNFIGTPSAPQKTKAKRELPRQKMKKKVEKVEPVYQEPANGEQYTAVEAGEILAFNKDSGFIITAMISRKQVPVGKSRLYVLKSQFERGIKIR